MTRLADSAGRFYYSVEGVRAMAYEKSVEMYEGEYIVMQDFGPDSFVMAFKTLEDAQEELAERDEIVDSYIVKVIERKPAREDERDY